MRARLPKTGRRYGNLLALGSAIGIACLLFVLIPLTQMMNEEEVDRLLLREVEHAFIRQEPPPKPEHEIEEEEVKIEEPDIELNQEPELVTIQSLSLSLSPGTGDAVAMGGPLAEIETGVGLVGSVRDNEKLLSGIFEFKDLEETPRILYIPTVRYPESLIRRQIQEGEVVMLIEISPEGKAVVERVISSTQPELESVAVHAVQRARFSIPKKGGIPVRVRGRLPLSFHAP